MKAAERIESQFGPTMLQSLGVRTPMEGATNNGPPKVIAAASPDDGRSRLREASLVDIDRISPDPNQVRKVFDEAAIDEMAQSLKEVTQLTPVLLRWDKGLSKWVIIAGERRYRGALKAGLKSLKAICLEEDITESDVRIYQLTENLQREDLRPIELAQSFEELMRLNGWTMDQLAAHIKKSKATVSRTMALLKLPIDIQQRVERGELSASTAYELLKKPTEAEQRREADRIVTQGVTRDELTGKKPRPSPKVAATGDEDVTPHPEKVKPASKVFKVGTATLTIRWAKASVRKRDIVAALEGALAEIRGDGEKVKEATET